MGGCKLKRMCIHDVSHSILSMFLQEYQDNNNSLSIADTSPKQSVYVFKCTKSTLKVSGKVNSIILG